MRSVIAGIVSMERRGIFAALHRFDVTMKGWNFSEYASLFQNIGSVADMIGNLDNRMIRYDLNKSTYSLPPDMGSMLAVLETPAAKIFLEISNEPARPSLFDSLEG